MLKWSLGSPSTSSISTSYFSDSDASNITITSRRRASSRFSSSSSIKSSSLNSNRRYSGYSSDFTNITDLSDFSDGDRHMSTTDDVFHKDNKTSMIDMSPYLDSSFALQNFEVCFSLKKTFNEIRIWIDVCLHFIFFFLFLYKNRAEILLSTAHSC